MNAFATTCVAVALAFSGGALAAEDAMSKDQYKAAAERIDQDYDDAKDRCLANVEKSPGRPVMQTR